MGSCKACGHRPSGQQRLQAWLFSYQYLDEEELEEAAARIRAGERPDPSPGQLTLAQKALNPVREQRPDGLSPEQQVLFLAGNLLLSPLLGAVAWAWWRRGRPRAADQLLWLTLPVVLVFGLAWLGMMYLRFSAA